MSDTQGLANSMGSSTLQWRLKSPAARLFTQPFIHAQIKVNIKMPVTRKMFPFDNVIMKHLGIYHQSGVMVSHAFVHLSMQLHTERDPMEQE